MNRNGCTLHKAIGHTLEETVGSGKVRRLLEVLQEPNEMQAQAQSDDQARGMCSLVPVLLSDVMRDKRVLVSRGGDGRD